MADTECLTLPETNMEAQKGPYKDYSPSKRALYGFPGFHVNISLGECRISGCEAQSDPAATRNCLPRDCR